jgi:uncharacterized delta-60 repeat protein
MSNYKGMSYSIVGDKKISPTSLNRDIEISLFKSGGFNKTGIKFSLSKERNRKNRIKDLISIKPKLIDLSEYQNLGFQSSLVGFDETLEVSVDKSASPRLVNYTEPYVIGGFEKTMFYTEVNHGLKIGDRVFINGGNYDIDLLIKIDKYKTGRDGYKVLFVDKCQIVLDIDWDLRNVWESDIDDNFIRVYLVDNLDDFISAEKALTTRGGTYSRKFNTGENNIIYTNKNYVPVNVWGNSTKITEAPGFFVRTDSTVLTSDTSFNSGIGFNLTGAVYNIAKQSDGKLIIGGSFTSYNGVTANKIIRLNVDGSIDSTFSTGSGFNGNVHSIGIQSNGKIIVGGKFTSYNGSNFTQRLCRINSNGTFDSTFQFLLPTFTWLNNVIWSIAVDSADSIYISGGFDTVVAKLTPSGLLDVGFSVGSGFGGSGSELVKVIKLQLDGKILCGGSFISYNGDVGIRKLVRLNGDGTADTQNFQPLAFPSSSAIRVNEIHIQSDGKILVGGNFTTYGNVDALRLIRFNTDCTPDTPFLTNSNLIGLDSDVRSITSLDVSYTITVNYYDAIPFQETINPTGFYNSKPYYVLEHGNGSPYSYIFWGISEPGSLNTGSFEWQHRQSFSIISGGFGDYYGTLDEIGILPITENNTWVAIDVNVSIQSIINSSSNGIFIGGNFTNLPKMIKLNVDGSLDDVYRNLSNFNYIVYDILLDSTNKLVVGGDFSFFNSLEVGKIIRLDETNWQNITSSFISGSFSSALSMTYSNNNRIKIFDGSFTYSIFEEINFKKGYIYKYNEAEEPNNYIGTYSTWCVDVTYQRPILTKTNFRGGDFKGLWNVGLFGRSDKMINWKGDKSTWKSGTILNTRWLSGDINTDFTQSESYYVDLSNGLPTQKLNGVDNNGRGYNYIINSEIINSKIERGNIIESKLGVNRITSLVEDTILGTNSVYDVESTGSYFENSEFINTFVRNSELRNSNIVSSLLDNIKSVNSYLKKSYVKNSDYIADSVIKILGYDELGLNLVSAISGDTHRIFKFYINEDSYKRLSSRDVFFIKGLDINDGQKNIINFFDRKFKISSWYDYSDSLSGINQFYKRAFDCAAFLSTPEENKLFNNSYSIDIIYSLHDVNNIFSNLSFTGLISIENAYIIDSDYESGVMESSNWNSGYHINSNNDLHITENPTVGGFYDLILQTSSSTILANTGYNTLRENNEDLVEIGDVVFLNAVSYDTRGKILSFTISSPGSEYVSGVLSGSGSGTGADFQIIASGIGSVTGLTISLPGGSYTDGPPGGGLYWSVGTTPIIASGSGLTVDIVVSSGLVTSVTVNPGNPGIGYNIGDIVEIDPNPSGGGATLTIESITNGEVLSVDLVSSGIGYSIGETVTLLGGGTNSTISVISVTGSLTRLPDAYKVIDIISNQYVLKDVINGTSSLYGLLDGGTFYTPDALNRWGYIHNLKMIKNLVRSGLLKGIYLKDNLIKNTEINLNDRDFNNLQLFKTLLISDTLFSSNDNILSKASYVRSSLTNGTDYWDDGLFYNSIWNGATFRSGLFKESSWNAGNFKNGIFYNSRSFNAQPTTDYRYYDVDRIKNYWKSGITSATISNDRYSWRSGTFSSGEFIKSDWEGGNFLNGKFWNSKWYNGNFHDGIIGDINISFEDTHFYNGLIKNAGVENASLFALDTSFTGLSSSNIVWETGVFNSGIFGCDIIIQTTASHTATWYDGVFNGGEFRTNGKWIDGVFNGGKFISGFGWTWSSTIDSLSTSASQFAWESGEFNGGEFGNAELGTNSTWWSGEFNGGEFKGRYWNDGIFTGGRFLGSATYSPIGGYTVDSMEESNSINFVNSFSQSFYGLWGGGWSSNVKDDFIKNKKLYTFLTRSIVEKLPKTITFFENMLWLSGTFSNPGGSMNGSVWLDGTFEKGIFKMSSFNPWVVRPGDAEKSFNLNDDLIGVSGSCIWLGGALEESEFYISQWNAGRFISGTAFGMVWKSGVSEYMNAWNVFWEGGTWRNGNWNGSFIDVENNGGVYLAETLSHNNNFHNQILYRGMNWNGTSSVHLWNVFEDEYGDIETQGDIIAATPSTVRIRPGRGSN